MALTGAAGVLALVTSAASAATLPQQWDPARVAVNHDPDNTFLLRPGQILAGPGDATAVQALLPGWRPLDHRPYGVTLFVRSGPHPADPAKEVLVALEKIRKATAGRPQGPAKVAPNYVFVGAAAAEAINFYGEPRVQGGPGSSARPAAMPGLLPTRGGMPTDGLGVRIAVLDTGLFKHPWLTSVAKAPNSDDVWDVEQDGYADAESGHGTFIAGLILQVAPAASVYSAQVLDSHGVGDDYTVAAAMQKLPADVNVVNLSLGGYTDRDEPPLAIANAMQSGKDGRIVVAAAGNDAKERPFWPAAFEQVLAVGAAEDDKGGAWTAAEYSNRGKWVDAVARGTNLQSTFVRATTKVAQGETIDPADPSIAFGGWAAWDGTSFATPIAAALIARTMTRAAISWPPLAQEKLLDKAPLAPREFPQAVLLDEL